VGLTQVIRSRLEIAPPWIVQEAFDTKHQSNWKDAYELVDEVDVPRNANVITSHVVYKVKTNEANEKNLKARIVPHGNHDKEKDEIRKDSSTAQFHVISLILSVVTVLGLRLAIGDIKGAYLQIESQLSWGNQVVRLREPTPSLINFTMEKIRCVGGEVIPLVPEWRAKPDWNRMEFRGANSATVRQRMLEHGGSKTRAPLLKTFSIG